MTDYIQVMTTLEKKEDAVMISRSILEEKLVACVQIIGPMISAYWWKGKIEEETEWLCLMKSRRDFYDRLEKRIKEIHPYDEPEILAIPVIEGSRGYLEWMDGELA